MLALETVVKIQADHFRNEVPIKAIARKRGVARNTVRKAVREGAEAFGRAARNTGRRLARGNAHDSGLQGVDPASAG